MKQDEKNVLSKSNAIIQALLKTCFTWTDEFVSSKEIQESLSHRPSVFLEPA